MKIWKIVPALPEHIPAIAARMREEDRREVWASHRHTPGQALENGLARSELAWTCFVHGKPAFMWGAARQGSLISRTGAPWLLGTEGIYMVRREFLKQSRAYVELMQKRFPRLENFVHAENRLSIRWLQWCGFVLDDIPELINDEDFFMFRRNADVYTGSSNDCGDRHLNCRQHVRAE
ncbi:MAG: hypothetical protein LBD42_04695 [Desulfovibrio sp.]|jgi:hypothetical protein|nr:hypothetical protein [Desulfovibrio sp.]